ncbi:MAG TPA: DUF4190 domain-containing protein [Micromonosporaceae bacterium]|nr:DUF4190 domain-containing protein [Micromonosporaceae bacterium]
MTDSSQSSGQFSGESSGWSDPSGATPPPAAGMPPPAAGQTGYGQSGYGQSPYGQAGYAAAGHGQTAGYGAYGQTVQQPAYVVYAAGPPTNGLAIASMIVSIMGLGPVGAIMGHMARRQIQERGEQGDGFALAGIIVGWVTTGLWLLCCVGYAIALAGGLAAGLTTA